MFFFLILVAFNSNAQVASSPWTVNTCQTSVRFFGLVTVWSGSINTYQINSSGVQELISSVPCGKNGGSWDWFWE